MIKLKMKNYNIILIEKQQKYQHYRYKYESDKSESDKYEYLTGEEILPSDQSRIIEQAKFIYSPLGKAFEKQIKIIGD